MSKIIALLFSTLKITISIENIDGKTKCINEYKINVQKKSLSKKDFNSNKRNLFFNT